MNKYKCIRNMFWGNKFTVGKTYESVPTSDDGLFALVTDYGDVVHIGMSADNFELVEEYVEEKLIATKHLNSIQAYLSFLHLNDVDIVVRTKGFIVLAADGVEYKTDKLEDVYYILDSLALLNKFM